MLISRRYLNPSIYFAYFAAITLADVMIAPYARSVKRRHDANLYKGEQELGTGS
jgi:hypothetical protein